MISAWMFIIIRKESYSIERIANIATFLIAAIFLLILFTLEAKDYTGIWILIFGQLVFTLNGERKGLLYAVIFYLISFTYIYQLIGINIEMIEYIRLIVISFTLTLLSYYYEISINTTYKSLEKSTNENKSNLLALQEINEEISQQIYIDKLTGLYNYSALELNIEKSNIPVLMIIDIDRFQSLNNIYGYDIGNLILKKFAEFLSDYAHNKKYKVYRIYGDEFVLFEDVEGFLNIKQYEKDMRELRSIIDKFKISIHGVDDLIDIDATIGLSIAQETPISTADIALRHAKTTHKECITYTTFIDNTVELKDSLDWTGKIKNAIASNHIIPVYQPIVNRNGEIIKFEVLMRMLELDDNDGYTLISPDKFLEVAIVTKQYPKLFSLMLDQLLREVKRSDKLFSINISFADMHDMHFVRMLENKLMEYSDVTDRIVFEILESEAIEDITKLKLFLARFKKTGIKIAIDDFGTGYSNFANVLLVKPDYIKIDGSLIKNIDTDKEAKAMVKSIIYFSKEFKAKIIAEYIHNEEVFNVAKELGVDEFQGYYFSAPIENIDKVIKEFDDKKDDI
jgi:diguanylate cyclase (GGDEF)-like protein